MLERVTSYLLCLSGCAPRIRGRPSRSGLASQLRAMNLVARFFVVNPRTLLGSVRIAGEHHGACANRVTSFGVGCPTRSRQVQSTLALPFGTVTGLFPCPLEGA